MYGTVWDASAPETLCIASLKAHPIGHSPTRTSFILALMFATGKIVLVMTHMKKTTPTGGGPYMRHDW